MIYIFTGDIRTGKTQTILALCNGRKDVGGFLSPDEDGKRVILGLNNRKIIPFEIEDDTQEVISVGRFHFLKAAFAESSSWALEDAESNDLQFVVVDEIGKLELQKRGYHDLILELVKKDWQNKDLVIVIRDFLLDELVDQYGLEKAIVVTKDHFAKIFSS